MAEVRIAPKAREDLKEIYEYISIELQNPQAAEDILTQLRSRIAGLSSFPQRGKPLAGVISFPSAYRYMISVSYNIFYRVEEEFVSIIRVLNHRQNMLQILFDTER